MEFVITSLCCIIGLLVLINVRLSNKIDALHDCHHDFVKQCSDYMNSVVRYIHSLENKQ